MIYKGCAIKEFADGYIWEDVNYGTEGDDLFPTIKEAKADIDRFFDDGPAPREIDGELYA